MKRLLVVMLLMLGISAVVSCNSYDVEGKPEIASNPAKKVFAYNPWEKDESNASKTDDNSGKDDANTNEGDGNNGAGENDDANEVSDDANENNGADEEDTNGTNGDDTNGTNGDDTNGTNGDGSNENGDPDGEGAVQDSNIVVRAATTNAEEITEKFEIYNRGVTGELKIRKINLLDPSGRKIEELGDADYKDLFKMQIQKMNKGLAVKDAFGEKVLTFDNMGKDNEADHILALCPLTDKKGSGSETARVCKDGFDKAKYNSSFTILLTYSGKAVKALKDKALSSDEYKQSGDFSIEICTNDPTKGSTDTCKGVGTSYRIQITRQAPKPPKPIIHVAFEYPIQKPMSYRNIYDQVQMNLKDTCVAMKDDPNTCDPDWASKYYIKYKWEMTESPTPLLDDSKLRLTESSSDSVGQWIPDDGVRDNPKRASFTGLMITPRRYDDRPNDLYNAEECGKCGDEPSDNGDKYFFNTLSKYLLCRQKYCEETVTKYYKINIQAEAVDKETDLVSDTTDITVVPKIIPQARVVAQLTWKQGFKTKAESESKEGVMIDIDIHMIKKSSLEAPDKGYTPTEGLLGTSYRSVDQDSCLFNLPECEKYWRHDDCSFSDQGLSGVDDGRTIQWHASLDIDNTWGGNNYETPETIGLGPIVDEDGDGVPDIPIIDDQYLLVVGYVGCNSLRYEDGLDRCAADYTGEDGVHEVDARVEILIDGFEAPRKEGVDRPADKYASKDFKIKVNDWKAIALVKWDGNLKGPETNQKYTGNAIVTEEAMADQGITVNAKKHPVCNYKMEDAVLLPIWDPQTYKDYVEKQDENGWNIGTCGPVDSSTPSGDEDTGDTEDNSDTGEDTGDTGEDTDDTEEVNDDDTQP